MVITQFLLLFVIFLPATAGISSVDGSLLSVTYDLSTQQIQVNCYTFRVEPDHYWTQFQITPDSSYQPVSYALNY